MFSSVNFETTSMTDNARAATNAPAKPLTPSLTRQFALLLSSDFSLGIPRDTLPHIAAWMIGAIAVSNRFILGILCYLAVCGYLLFFIGMWILISFTVSRMGWRSFSSRYPAPFRPPGLAYASPFSRFGSIFASYRDVVRVIVTDTGIYFYPMFLFRPFHRPFLLPWTSVRRIEKKAGFFRQGYRLDIEDAAGEIHVLLPTKAEADLFRFHKLAPPKD
jgi:hypothetical protein